MCWRRYEKARDLAMSARAANVGVVRPDSAGRRYVPIFGRFGCATVGYNRGQARTVEDEGAIV
jgi:hypothetical protein